MRLCSNILGASFDVTGQGTGVSAAPLLPKKDRQEQVLPPQMQLVIREAGAYRSCLAQPCHKLLVIRSVCAKERCHCCGPEAFTGAFSSRPEQPASAALPSDYCELLFETPLHHQLAGQELESREVMRSFHGHSRREHHLYGQKRSSSPSARSRKVRFASGGCSGEALAAHLQKRPAGAEYATSDPLGQTVDAACTRHYAICQGPGQYCSGNQRVVNRRSSH